MNMPHDATPTPTKPKPATLTSWAIHRWLPPGTPLAKDTQGRKHAIEAMWLLYRRDGTSAQCWELCRFVEPLTAFYLVPTS